MKNIIYLIFALILFSCGSAKIAKEKEKTLKGNWILSKITYSKTGSYNVTLFGDTSKDCFEGSVWSFVPNNNTGTYSIQKKDCKTGEREFIFDIVDPNETGNYSFLLKPKNNNDANIGFSLDIININDVSMILQQNITVNGLPFLINMNFDKQ